jgi:hypothetical protein
MITDGSSAGHVDLSTELAEGTFPVAEDEQLWRQVRVARQ